MTRPVPLSAPTLERLDRVFAPEDRDAAAALLVAGCGRNLPFLEEQDDFDRLRFAALKLSGGTLHGLAEAVALAKLDWRDLLVASGFGDDFTAHERWHP